MNSAPSKYALRMRLRHDDDTMERAMGVVRRRNFRFEGCAAEPSESGWMDATIQCRGEGNAQALRKHVAKIIGVATVELFQEEVRSGEFIEAFPA